MSKPREMNCTTVGWSVEARSTAHAPEAIGEQIFDERWQPVKFAYGMPGVPTGSPFDGPWLQQMGLLGYASAQALRWWFHAEAPRALCIETRLVKHAVTVAVSAARQTEHDVVSGEDRSSIMPDWQGKKDGDANPT